MKLGVLDTILWLLLSIIFNYPEIFRWLRSFNYYKIITNRINKNIFILFWYVTSNVYFRLRFGLVNFIDAYLRLRICLVLVVFLAFNAYLKPYETGFLKIKKKLYILNLGNNKKTSRFFKRWKGTFPSHVRFCNNQ